MKVLFLDFDGVLNSRQSEVFYEHHRDQEKWEEGMRNWPGSLFEYIALKFCPIAMSNLDQIVRLTPDLKIVISSSWRKDRTIDELKKFLSPAKLAADAVVDKTLHIRETERGYEIKEWLDRHSEVTHYVILDDFNDMLEEQKEHFVHTSPLHGLQYRDVLQALRILKQEYKRENSSDK